MACGGAAVRHVGCRRHWQPRQPGAQRSRLLHCRRRVAQAMLSIGAAMLGAQHVVGLDLDDDALRIAQQNVDEYEDPLPVRRVGGQARRRIGGAAAAAFVAFVFRHRARCPAHPPALLGAAPAHSAAPRAPCPAPQIDFVRCDVRSVGAQQRLKADTVIMNPPFGTRRKGAGWPPSQPDACRCANTAWLLPCACWLRWSRRPRIHTHLAHPLGTVPRHPACT